ncbi:MAG TPA: hypothetical protein VIT65_05280 [Microlunatus sp.]
MPRRCRPQPSTPCAASAILTSSRVAEHQAAQLPLSPSATHSLDTFLVALDRVLADRQFLAMNPGAVLG